MNREDIMRMAEASGVEDSLLYEHWRCNLESMTKFAELVASAEREACAEICNHIAKEDGWEGGYAYRCAIHIRARGQA
jgi:hypothetical protein